MLRAAFDAVAARQPDAVAVIDHGTAVSYSELRLRSGRFARLLADRAGLQRGDRLAVCLPNCWEVAAGVLASAGIGAVWAPFHPEWRPREIAWLASQLSPRALIARGDMLGQWRESGALPATVVLIDDADVRDALLTSTALPPPSPQPESEPCVCFPTSGSTGRPRIVFRSACNLISAQSSTAKALGLGSGMRQLSAVPFYHSGGFDNCLLLPLLYGMCVTLPDSFAPAEVEAAVRDHWIQVLMGSPFVYTMLAESGATRASFESVEVAVSFGAPMPPKTAAACESMLGLRIRQLYGSTETGVIAIQRAGSLFRPGLAGHPVESAEVRILGEHGEWLGPSCTGNLAVRGPGVISAHFDPADSDAGKFQDGFYLTGDSGRLEPDGELILCGRSKAIINISGIKVDPVEIEHVLLEMPEIRACNVHGVRDERQGEVIEALIELRPDCTLTRRAVVAHCRAHLSESKIPRRIEFAAATPMDAAGKKRTQWAPAGE
jgi:long-chain acyl-CoA synthetase